MWSDLATAHMYQRFPPELLCSALYCQYHVGALNLIAALALEEPERLQTAPLKH